MKPQALIKSMCGTGLAISLMACQAPPPPEPTSPPPPPPPSAPASVPMSEAESITGDNPSQYALPVERVFAEGLALYDKGEYAAAIRKFRSYELSRAWPELHVRALKYLAFSYCVTNKLLACQKAFYDALQIDPKFDLKPSEKGHPIWGPIFEKAKLGPPQQSKPSRRVKRRPAIQ